MNKTVNIEMIQNMKNKLLMALLACSALWLSAATWAQILDLAEAGRGEDRFGYRQAFIELVDKARALKENS